jgi:hypothetical protein
MMRPDVNSPGFGANSSTFEVKTIRRFLGVKILSELEWGRARHCPQQGEHERRVLERETVRVDERVRE